MTATDFLRHLEQPRLLYQLPLTELQQLAVRFPYSANLRLLLLLKTHLDGHPEEASYLARCAATTFDRPSIYDVLRDLDAAPEQTQENEGEVLELRELDDLMLETIPEPTLPLSLAEPLPGPATDDVFVSGWEEELLLPEEGLESEVEDSNAEEPTLAVAAKKEQELATPETEASYPAHPSDQGPQSASLTGYGTLQERLARIRQRQHAKGFEDKEDVNRIARRSLVAQEVVASETLAKLLIQQGQHQNAIKMYQRLILLYPEKKTTFANLIKDLKEKL